MFGTNLSVTTAIQLGIKTGLLEASFSSHLVVLRFDHLLGGQDVVTEKYEINILDTFRAFHC